jgi:hypothetical protein
MKKDDELVVAVMALFFLIGFIILYITPMYITDKAIERAKKEILEEMQQPQEIKIRVIYETPEEPSDDEITIDLRDEYKGGD